MDSEHDSHPDHQNQGERTDAGGNFYQGNEAFFGVFTQCQVYVNGVRLVHEGRVTQQVSDLASQVENNRRRFLHSGDVNFAIQELSRITNSFNQRVQSWESQASQREQNKKAMSGGALAKMKAELSMVRTNVRLASRTLTKLEVELQQISGRESFEATQRLRKLQNDSADESTAPSLEPAPKTCDSKAAPTPELTEAELAAAKEHAATLNRILAQLIGHEMVVSFDLADRKTESNPDHVEQVWDTQAMKSLSVFLVASWTVIHPMNLGEAKPQRKRLDLSFWLIPKSQATSEALSLVGGQLKVSVGARKMDPADISFEVARPDQSPYSDYVTGFLGKFMARYGDDRPPMLLAQLRNLEWIQKKVVVTCFEN